jgi:hypothetical protein
LCRRKNSGFRVVERFGLRLWVKNIWIRDVGFMARRCRQ